MSHKLKCPVSATLQANINIVINFNYLIIKLGPRKLAVVKVWVGGDLESARAG